MRVLYLSYDGLTDPLGQSQILPYLIGLTKKGHRIDIISFEKPAAWAANGQEITKICTHHQLGYYPMRYRKKPPVISTLADIRTMKRQAIKLHKKHHYQIVHCRSYITSLVGLQLKQKFSVRYIFDMRGFYADERVDGGIWPQSSWVYTRVFRYFKQKEKAFLAHADHIISLTHSARDELQSWKVTTSPITVIPCCTDTDHFNPSKVNQHKAHLLRENLQIAANQPVVGYIGSTGTWYLLTEMLQYFKLLLDKFPAAVFLFLTFDPPETILHRARQLSVPQKSLRIVSVPRADLPHYMSLFDWSIFFIQPLFSKKASSPTKQGELMSMGLPVVCNAAVGDTEDIVTKYEAGICLADTSEKNLRDAVEKSELLLNADREKIKLGAKDYFSLQKGIDHYHQIYSEIGK